MSDLLGKRISIDPSGAGTPPPIKRMRAPTGNSARLVPKQEVGGPAPQPGAFVELGENLHSGDVSKESLLANYQPSWCKCSTAVNGGVCGGDCTNRRNRVECDPTLCVAGDNCSNQVLQRSIVHQLDLLAGLSPDRSTPPVLQQEQVENDETVGDELLNDREGISARDLQHQLVVVDSHDVPVLPEEVVLNLFEFMKPGDILAASQTCQLWRSVGENNKLWQQKCKEAGLGYNLTAADQRALGGRNKNTTIAYSAWKENFLKPYKIERKFREGVPNVITIKMSIGKMEFFNDKIIVNDYKNLYIFCASSGKLLQELVGHKSFAKGFQMNDLFIIYGSHDRSVKVLDVDSGSCLHTMHGHTGAVFCLKMHATIAVSGSYDRTLRMWDVREGKCLGILSGHISFVQHVQFDGGLVVSGSSVEIKIWDRETGECLRSMNHISCIVSLKFNGVDVVAGDDEGFIKVWDVNTGDCRHTLVGNGSRGMELQGNILVCGGADVTTVKICSISNGACIHTLAGPQKHSGWITGIQLNEKSLVTSSADGTVKLWDIKTGEFIRDLLVLESDEWVWKMRMKDAKIVCHVLHKRGAKLLVLNFDTNNDNDLTAKKKTVHAEFFNSFGDLFDDNELL